MARKHPLFKIVGDPSVKPLVWRRFFAKCSAAWEAVDGPGVGFGVCGFLVLWLSSLACAATALFHAAEPESPILHLVGLATGFVVFMPSARILLDAWTRDGFSESEAAFWARCARLRFVKAFAALWCAGDWDLFGAALGSALAFGSIMLFSGSAAEIVACSWSCSSIGELDARLNGYLWAVSLGLPAGAFLGLALIGPVFAMLERCWIEAVEFSPEELAEFEREAIEKEIPPLPSARSESKSL